MTTEQIRQSTERNIAQYERELAELQARATRWVELEGSFEKACEVSEAARDDRFWIKTRTEQIAAARASLETLK